MHINATHNHPHTYAYMYVYSIVAGMRVLFTCGADAACHGGASMTSLTLSSSSIHFVNVHRGSVLRPTTLLLHTVCCMCVCVVNVS